MSGFRDRLNYSVTKANAARREEQEAARKRQEEHDQHEASLQPEVARLTHEVLDVLREHGIQPHRLYEKVQAGEKRNWHPAGNSGVSGYRMDPIWRYKPIGECWNLFVDAEDYGDGWHIKAQYGITNEGSVIGYRNVWKAGNSSSGEQALDDSYLTEEDYILKRWTPNSEAHWVLNDQRLVDVLTRTIANQGS